MLSNALQYAGITGLSLGLLSLLFLCWRMQGNGDERHMWYHEFGPWLTAITGFVVTTSLPVAFNLQVGILAPAGALLGFALGCAAATYGYKQALPGGRRAHTKGLSKD